MNTRLPAIFISLEITGVGAGVFISPLFKVQVCYCQIWTADLSVDRLIDLTLLDQTNSANLTNAVIS